MLNSLGVLKPSVEAQQPKHPLVSPDPYTFPLGETKLAAKSVQTRMADSRPPVRGKKDLVI